MDVALVSVPGCLACEGREEEKATMLLLMEHHSHSAELLAEASESAMPTCTQDAFMCFGGTLAREQLAQKFNTSA